jgi:hypothetical protein
MTAEQTAAAHALDALYAKYGCEADGRAGNFDRRATVADRDEANRLAAIVWPNPTGGGLALMDFVRTTAKLTKDGECESCGLDGSEPNPACPDHEPWDMPNDDAVDALHSLIDQARGLL